MVILRALLLIWLSLAWHNTATAKTIYTSEQARNGQVTDAQLPDGSDVLIYAAEGGDVSGGGSTLLFQSRRILLDVFFDDIASQKKADSQPINYGRNRVDRLKIADDNVNSQLEKGFEKINQVSPSLAVLLREIYVNTPIYFVAGRFRIKDANYFLNPYLEYPADAKLSTSALNIRGIGILISKSDFSEMDSFNQAALIMHELIRYLQIHFSVNLKNSDIQNLTRSAMVPHLQFKKSLVETALNFMSQTYLSDLKDSVNEVAIKINNLEKNSQNDLTAEKQTVLTNMLRQLGSLHKAVKSAHYKSLSSMSWDSILKIHQEMAERQSLIISNCSAEKSDSLPECQKFNKLIGDLIR